MLQQRRVARHRERLPLHRLIGARYGLEAAGRAGDMERARQSFAQMKEEVGMLLPQLNGILMTFRRERVGT